MKDHAYLLAVMAHLVIVVMILGFCFSLAASCVYAFRSMRGMEHRHARSRASAVPLPSYHRSLVDRRSLDRQPVGDFGPTGKRARLLMCNVTRCSAWCGSVCSERCIASPPDRLPRRGWAGLDRLPAEVAGSSSTSSPRTADPHTREMPKIRMKRSPRSRSSGARRAFARCMSGSTPRQDACSS